MLIRCVRFYSALYRCGNSACFVIRRSLVQIRAAPNVEMMEISFIILFTRYICLNIFVYICLNYFYPLCALLRGFVSLWL